MRADLPTLPSHSPVQRPLGCWLMTPTRSPALRLSASVSYGLGVTSAVARAITA